MNGVTTPLTFDLKNPLYEIQDPTKYIRRPLPQFFIDYINSVYHTVGLYAQNQLEITPCLGLLLGVRYELFADERDYGDGSDNIKQQKLLPRAGLTYSLLDNLNYFATYSAGFRPLKPEYIRFPERYGRNTAFNSETSYQLGTGLKGDFFNKVLFGTLAVYQIVKRNQVVNTGSLTTDGAPVYRQNGQARSRGFFACVVHVNQSTWERGTAVTRWYSQTGRTSEVKVKPKRSRPDGPLLWIWHALGRAASWRWRTGRNALAALG